MVHSTSAATVKDIESSNGKSAAPEIILLQIDAIRASKTNPRKRFDEAALQELAGSVTAHGLLQPITVRPLNGNSTYEIVTGERRWRACRIARLHTMPCIVRELSDEEARELQWIENLQREDLDPIEEAEGYQLLMKEHGVSVEDISAKVGKPCSHIYRMLALVQLPKKLKEAVATGEVRVKTALLFARITDAKLREVAVKQFFDAKEKDVRRAHADIARELLRVSTLDLAHAPFDVKDELLVAKAGACVTCSKRTGNSPDLFGDAPGNLCTDGKCYRQKLDALWERVVTEAKAVGQKVLSDTEAANLFPDRFRPGVLGYDADKLWIDLDAEMWVDGQRKTWRQLLGPKCPKPVLARATDGSIHHLLPKQQTLDWAKEQGLKWAQHSGNGSGRMQRSPEERTKLREQVRKEKVRKATASLLAHALAQKLADKGLAGVWESAVFWREMMAVLQRKSYSDEIRMLVNRRGWRAKGQFPGESFRKHLEPMKEAAELRELFWELFMLTGAAYVTLQTTGATFAQLLKIDVPGIQKKAQEMFPVKKRESAKTERVKKPKTKKGEKPRRSWR